MTLADRIRLLTQALPSDGSAVTLTRADLLALLEEGPQATSATSPDLTVEEVATEVRRAPSTVRGWLIAGELHGYKLNGRDWRVPRPALRAYLDHQVELPSHDGVAPAVNLGAWRQVRRSAHS